jgi:ankyrin repeat protein
MRFRFGTKSLFLTTLLIALSLAALNWWARRPVYVKTKDGQTLSMHGIHAVWASVMRKDDDNLSRLLLLDRYDLNRPSSGDSGWTMLQRAIFRESPECVEILLEHGADPNLHYGDSPTPLELARRTRNQSIVNLLRHHGAADHSPD